MTGLRYLILTIFAVGMWAAPRAVAQPEAPVSQIERGTALPISAIDVHSLPAVDNEALLDRDEARMNPAEPEALQFAEPFDFHITPDSRGTWEVIGGYEVWRLVVSSPGAFSINAGFSSFELPEGAALWLYPSGEAPRFRSFTSADHQPDGQLWTPIVPGEEMVIELNLPDTKHDLTYSLELGRLSHAYRPFGIEGGDLMVGRSGSCNVDVICPQGDGYRDIIRSSATFSRGGSRICSGSAVNNTAQDGRPFFLSANHCGTHSASSMVVYWNYENSSCRPPGSPGAGGPGDGSLTQFSTGATLRGSGSASDWALFELNQDLDPEFQVFLSGWDRRDQATSSAVAIHHPRTQEKRISFEYDPTQITNYLQSSPNPNGTHVHVIDWDLGTTEPGSSGSPLYSPEKRVIGQLHGGYAACGNNLADWYGRVYHSMNTGMAQWLDPGNTGAQYIDGREAGEGVFASMSASPALVTPGSEVTLTVSITNATDAALTGLSFTNVMPDGLTFLEVESSSGGQVTTSSTSIAWALDLGEGEEGSLVYTAFVGNEVQSNIVNTATLDHTSFDDPIQLATTIQIFLEADLIFENTTTVSIPDNGCPTMTTSTINVPETFVWNDVQIGVQVSHTWRGDLRIMAESPSGTMVSLLDRPGTGTFGTSASNLDAKFVEDGPSGVFGSGTVHTLGAPPYQVEGRPEQGAPGNYGVDDLSDFYGEDPEGTWTLHFCDGAAADTGSLQQWALMFFLPPVGDEGGAGLTEAYRLDAAYPNPFTNSTLLTLAVRDAQHVRAEVYDALGRRVQILHDGAVEAGFESSLTLNGSTLPSGLYVVRVAGETFSTSQKVMIVR